MQRKLSIFLVIGFSVVVHACDSAKATWTKPSTAMSVKFLFSNDIAIGIKNKLEIVDSQSGSVTRQYDLAFENVRSISFSPDGLFLAAGGGKTFGSGWVSIWNLQTNQVVQSTSFGKEVDSIDFAPDGKTLAISASDKTVRLLDVQSGTIESLDGHTGEVLEVAFLGERQLLASAGSEGTIKIWNISAKEVFREFADCDTEFVFSAKLRMITARSKQANRLKLFDIDTGRLVREIELSIPQHYSIKRIAFLNDSKLIAIAGGEDVTNAGDIRIYETESGEMKKVLTGHHGLVTDFSVSLYSPLLVSSGVVVKDQYTVLGEVKVWDISGL